jgi:hypothetical protein
MSEHVDRVTGNETQQQLHAVLPRMNTYVLCIGFQFLVRMFYFAFEGRILHALLFFDIRLHLIYDMRTHLNRRSSMSAHIYATLNYFC